MGGLVRVKVSHLLISVVVLLVLSLANLGLTIFGNFQTQSLVRGQRVIEERVLPLCLSEDTVEACKRQIDAAKRSVVVRLCRIVHERLHLPRAECETVVAAAIKRNAAASAHGGSRNPRGPPASGATGPGKSGVGSIPGGSNGEGPKHNPPGTGQRQPPPQQGGGGAADQGPQTPNGNQGQGKGGGSVGAEGRGSAAGVEVEVEAEVKVPALEVPPIVPKAVEAATGAVEGVRSGVEGALGQ